MEPTKSHRSAGSFHRYAVTNRCDPDEFARGNEKMLAFGRKLCYTEAV